VTSAKRLIVNADDLGRTPGVNRGILEAHRRGIVTSATMLVTAEAAAEVPALARETPELGIGLHLAFTGGSPASAPALVPSLVDAGGRLPAGTEGLASAQPGELLAEARAQLRRFRDLMGRDPTHFDSHHHAHRLPAVLEVVVALAWETGLPVRSASEEMRASLRREGITTVDHFVEEFYGDGATTEVLVRLLARLPVGTSELMCHPAVVDDALRAGSRYAEPRAQELAALTHMEARQVVQAAGIRLVHYGTLDRPLPGQ
jgi:hypothetical protein